LLTISSGTRLQPNATYFPGAQASCGAGDLVAGVSGFGTKSPPTAKTVSATTLACHWRNYMALGFSLCQPDFSTMPTELQTGREIRQQILLPCARSCVGRRNSGRFDALAVFRFCAVTLRQMLKSQCNQA
jgi:hypothetical protein